MYVFIARVLTFLGPFISFDFLQYVPFWVFDFSQYVPFLGLIVSL